MALQFVGVFMSHCSKGKWLRGPLYLRSIHCRFIQFFLLSTPPTAAKQSIQPHIHEFYFRCFVQFCTSWAVLAPSSAVGATSDCFTDLGRVRGPTRLGSLPPRCAHLQFKAVLAEPVPPILPQRLRARGRLRHWARRPPPAQRELRRQHRRQRMCSPE